jgi:hypothetical protein
MTKHDLRSLDDLPLFADDASIGVALFGPGDRAREWPSIASLLEARGLPRIDPLMGGRYVRAVKAFFDHDCGLTDKAPLAPDGIERLGTWQNRKQRRA